MKYFILMALCLSAAVAEELHERGVDFHRLKSNPNSPIRKRLQYESMHYSQHKQTLEEAKRQVSDVLDGQHADFEEVGSYGGLGGVGVGTVGFSGQSAGEYGSSSGSNAEYSSSAASSFGASHSANLASSASFGSNSNYASGTHGSALLHAGSTNYQQTVPEVVVGGGAGRHESYVGQEEHRSNNRVVAPFHSLYVDSLANSANVARGPDFLYTGNVKYTELTPTKMQYSSSASENYVHHDGNAQQIVPDVSGSSGRHESYVGHEEHRSNNQVVAPSLSFYVDSAASSASDVRAPDFSYTGNVKYHPLKPVPTQSWHSGSENYVHHEENRAQAQTSTPVIQFAPSSAGAEKYVHVREEHVQQAPMQLVVTSPAGGQESFMKYRKVTTTASQPQVFVHTAPSSSSSSYLHQSTAGSTTGSQLGSLVTGGLTGTNTNYKTGNLAYTVPSVSFDSAGLNSAHSNSLFKSGYGASNQAASNFGTSSTFGAGHQAGFGTNSAYTDETSFGSKFGSQSKFGSALGADSKFGSQFGAESAFGSGSTFGTGSTVSGLHNYMQESERLAKLQAQGMGVGGTRAGGSQIAANLESGNAAGLSGFGALSAVGAGNAGYKTKSWEKASKWSSQSEFGSDGHVNNYKELSTGESENYDINGRRAGYKAATTTLDDNGKVSSYSLHT